MSGEGGDTIRGNLEEFDVEKSNSSKYLVKKSKCLVKKSQQSFRNKNVRVSQTFAGHSGQKEIRRSEEGRRAGEGDLSGD